MNPQELVTLTTFQQIAAAKLLQNKLSAAGIESFIADGETITTDWLLSNALGGIKLQVRPGDYDAAQEVMAEKLDDAEIAQMADEAADKEAAPDDSPEPVLNAREQLAQSIWRGAWMSLMFPPMYFFVFYLLFKVYFREEPIHAVWRKRLWIATALTIPWILVGLTFLSFLLREILEQLFAN